MTADIIYHLFDQFTAYMEEVKKAKREEAAERVSFPCVLKIMPNCIFNKRDPIVVGVDIVKGIARVGTQICVPSQGFIDIGKISSMELNHKQVDKALPGQSVAMKIQPQTSTVESAVRAPLRSQGRACEPHDPAVHRHAQGELQGRTHQRRLAVGGGAQEVRDAHRRTHVSSRGREAGAGVCNALASTAENRLVTHPRRVFYPSPRRRVTPDPVPALSARELFPRAIGSFSVRFLTRARAPRGDSTTRGWDTARPRWPPARLARTAPPR